MQQGLTPEGPLQKPAFLTSESFYRAAAESAMRAVRVCSPLEGLPTEKYQQWQTLLLNFDPQEMLGG